MKKAERIYRATKAACRRQIEAFGYEENPNGMAVGFNFVNTEEVVCARTLNEMCKLIKSDYSLLKTSYKLGVVDNEEYERRTQILQMVEATIFNTRNNI